jgi:hypothetical protein
MLEILVDETDPQLSVPAALMQRYMASLPEKEAQLRVLWQAYSSDRSTERLSDLRSLLHKFAGSTSMYGLIDLGQDLRIPLRAADALLDRNDASAGKALDEGMGVVLQSFGRVNREAMASATAKAGD